MTFSTMHIARNGRRLRLLNVRRFWRLYQEFFFIPHKNMLCSVLALHLLLVSAAAFGPRALFTVGFMRAASNSSSKTSLYADLRIRIQGTKNAYTTLRTGDVVSYLLPTSVGSKTRRLGALSEDGKILPLCSIVEGGADFVADPSEKPLIAEKMRDENLLLRVISSSRSQGSWLVEEYLDNDFYLPVLSQQLTQTRPVPSSSPSISPSAAPTPMPLQGKSDVADTIQQAEAQIQSLQSLVSSLQSMAKRQVVHSDHAPKAVGPYSQAIKTSNLIFASGCIGLDPVTGQLVQGLEAQTRQALANLQAILHAADTSLSKLVKTTIYLTNMADYAVVNKLYAEVLREGGCTDFPARTTVQVSALPLGAVVEIEAIATN